MYVQKLCIVYVRHAISGSDKWEVRNSGMLRGLLITIYSLKFYWLA